MRKNARPYWSPHLHDDAVRNVPVFGLAADGQPVEVELRGGHGERELGITRGGELRPADVELVPAGREAELGGARHAGHRQARVEGLALQLELQTKVREDYAKFSLSVLIV